MTKPVLKIGDRNPYVVNLQQLLNVHGYRLHADGIFGSGTERAVMSFQKSKQLLVDGIVGQTTWAALESGSGVHREPFHPCVDKFYGLNPGQFVRGPVNKIGVIIHHTVSNGNPDKVIDMWNADSRGAVGTHFVIGRKLDNGSVEHDGKIVQCVDLEDWVYHVATTRDGFSRSHNDEMNKYYVGIELCSWGCLDRVGDKFYAKGTEYEIPSEEVEILETPWRTFKYWHTYTPAQMQSLSLLLKALHGNVGIDLKNRPYDIEMGIGWFELSWEMLNFRRKIGIHSSVERGKFDAYPSTLFINTMKETLRTL